MIDPDIDEEDPYYLQCKYFIDCIDNDRPIENATFEEGRDALELARAATKAAKTGKPVKIK